MKNQASIHMILRVALVFGAASLTGCPGGEEEEGSGTSDGTESTTDDPPVTSTSSSSDDGVDVSTGSSGSSGAESTTTGEPDDPFIFPTDPYDAYTQIDRHGAVEAGTAGILASAGLGLGGEDLSLRDMYNASNPAEDAAGMWLGDITDSVNFFHANLDDDIIGFGLTPATPVETVAQAGPVIVPDTIKYDPSMATAYPNGRTLTDQVVDITLAAVLIQLSDTQPLSTFADIPLNPPENDVPFLDEFPYLAPPHPPM